MGKANLADETMNQAKTGIIDILTWRKLHHVFLMVSRGHTRSAGVRYHHLTGFRRRFPFAAEKHHRGSLFVVSNYFFNCASVDNSA